MNADFGASGPLATWIGQLLPHNAEDLAPFYRADQESPDHRIPRIVSMRAHRFQIQERPMRELVGDFMGAVWAAGASVSIDAVHLCMCARGPRSSLTRKTTTYAAGIPLAPKE